MKFLLAILVAATAFAGCLGDDGSSNTPEPQPLDDAMAAFDAGLTAANIEKIGEYAQGNSAEIDAWENYLAVMQGGQVRILDIRDPTNPLEVGLNNQVPRVLDVKWSNDGQYIFVGDDERLSGDVTGDLPTRTGGVYVLDTSDKTNPRLIEHLNVGQFRGPHMVFYHETPDGDELVFGANGDIGIFRWDRETEELTELARYAAGPLDFNRNLDVIDVYYQLTAHDLFVMHDDRDDAELMYVANWDAGLRIVDVTAPANPVELGAWNDFPDGHSGNLHTVVTEWIGERRITAGAVEVGFDIVGGVPYILGTEKSILYIWDTTDPANIQLLGFWENPEGLSPGRGGYIGAATGDELLSTHNIQLENGRLSMAHYGLGVWVFDVSTPEFQAAPHVIAYYDAPGMNTWDVLPHDGVLWSSGAVGIQALHLSGDVIGTGPRGRA